jgi:flagellar biosynthesis chaperone FliJ
VLIWIELIRDKAATEGITPKEAVALIVQELKLYNQFNCLEKAIQKHQQDLEVLNIAIEQTQQAYRSLVNLRSKGISDTEIIEMNKLINSRNEKKSPDG